MSKSSIVLIGYSGHAFVVADTALAAQHTLVGYCEQEKKTYNPFQLHYWGSETSPTGLNILQTNQAFIAIGNNRIRAKVATFLAKQAIQSALLIHPSAVIASSVLLQAGTLIAPNSTINALAKIGQGVICNTASIIEHECQIGDFAHIAPGATLAGNVTIGQRTFVGANSVIRQGIQVGNDVTIGAGAVVVKDIPDGQTVVGNPARPLQKR